MAESSQADPLRTVAHPGPVPSDSGAISGFPASFGRYRVNGLLGRGGFGAVYSGHDDMLGRKVAIKVPLLDRNFAAEQIDSLLTEARVVAQLDHPHIVRVHDCGRTDDGLCYIVSQLIDGGDLADRLRRGGIPLREGVSLIVRLAEALHYAHRMRIVHRDIKPSNILIDRDGRPFLADFGLALREERVGSGPTFAGTPRYMSPEQARGEGHRVDGRSDIYSLGVVLFELLAGRTPFVADDQRNLLELISSADPPPLRQLVDGLPRELDRICLKALARKATDRYDTASDFADDLRHWLDRPESQTPNLTYHVPTPSTIAIETPPGIGIGGSTAVTSSIHVVPKGLRAFDAKDSEFFLHLLPGPRDRNGFPAGLRFWKDRLEETNPDRALSVGLVYGPSGCGKSSLVQAGLLPRLGESVASFFIDASGGSVESRLLRTLVRRFPDLSPCTTLASAVAELRMRPRAGRVLLAIDQLEQWLAGRKAEENAELIGALRQCDGLRVQALLLVRDDFWMAATRLFRDLEVPLREGENSAAVDLFDERHARSVLRMFGQSFGALSERPTPDHERFIEQAVAGLAQDGRVIPVRLCLFAEMVKTRPWKPATLKSMGGAEGIGEAFLEQSFGDSAPPEHRLHQQAARNVLKALLPATGAVIRGRAVALSEILAASGYVHRSRDFESLLGILDTELRLVTPTDAGSRDTTAGDRTYQLTHDYLVPSIRQWLGRKQRETRRGRAQLLLADRASLWLAKPEPRFLPSMTEWLRIRLFTRRRDWSPSERAMMSRGRRYHGVRVAIVCALLAATGWVAWDWHGRQKAQALVDQLMSADAANTPDLVRQIGAYRRWATPLLTQTIDIDLDRNQRFRVELALAASDPDRLEELVRQAGASDANRSAAVAILIDHGARPEVLFDLVYRSGPDEFGRGIEAMRANRPAAIRHLRAEVEKQPPSLPDAANQEVYRAADEVANSQARRRATAAIALLQLGDAESVWPFFGYQKGDRVRAFLIRDSIRLRTEPGVLIDRLTLESDISARRALLLALGEAGECPLLGAAREKLIAELLRQYRVEPDPGVHGAIDWLLRQRWGLTDAVVAADEQLRGLPGRDRRWFVNSQRQTLAVIAACEFLMGAAPGESNKKADNPRHRRRIARSFAVATKEVTVEQFQHFDPDYKPKLEVVPKPDCPATGIDWRQSARYCNWLSQQEGLAADQWCYVIEGNSVRMPPDYLQRTGYRLPTEAEWECAARSGASTSRHYGTSEELLGEYAWYYKTSDRSTWPVGRLKPNDYGMFDMLGNAMEWIQGEVPSKGGYLPVNDLIDDIESDLEVSDSRSRGNRGGMFIDKPIDVRCARRFGASPSELTDSLGFRIARTVSTK